MYGAKGERGEDAVGFVPRGPFFRVLVISAQTSFAIQVGTLPRTMQFNEMHNAVCMQNRPEIRIGTSYERECN